MICNPDQNGKGFARFLSVVGVCRYSNFSILHVVMPFTFAHPAIILPATYLPKRWYSLKGLVIGSMTPDFEYFIRMKVQSDYSHTVKGVFYFDLPIGLLLCFIFHCIVRNPLYESSPSILRKRMSQFESFNWVGHFKQNSAVICCSLIAGAATHIFWDGFTHATGYFVQNYPALKNSVSILSFDIPFYKILQHSSSASGLCIIVLYISKLPIEKGNKKNTRRFWPFVASIAIAITALRFLGGLNYRIYGDVFVTMISSTLLAIILASVFLCRSKHPLRPK